MVFSLKVMAAIPLLVLGSVIVGLPPISAAPLADQARDIIRDRVEASRTPEKVVCRGELICESDVLPRFYENRLFWPAWSSSSEPLSIVDVFIQALQDANLEGLRGADYHLASIKSLLGELRLQQAGGRRPEPAMFADLDLLLTDAFLIYASHLLNGRVDPETIRAEWYVKSQKGDLVALLQTALDSNDVKKALKSVTPPHEGYARLRRVLAYYRGIAETGGWGKLVGSRKIAKGDSGERILALRNRLIRSGDFRSKESPEVDLFGDELENAVRRFQGRHGLAQDGVVGPATSEALNVPVEDRIRQIEVNMERWRWLPQTLGTRYLFVNIANFELGVMEDSQRVMSMRAIVGKPYQRTPAFNAKMTYLVLNPYWNVPSDIARKEMLPLIKKDPEYLHKNNIRVFSGRDSDRKEVNPADVDWTSFTSGNFPYFFRQDAGPKNALGSIKFMFPNRFNVYLHDTPHRELFNRTVRPFSHGCIRVEKALELAEYLLAKDSRWTRETILEALDGSVDRAVKIPDPIEVYILYWTAWVDEDGRVQFRNDIYGRDKPLADALEEKPPRL
jgi:murein L,D-transpeptidase YcbB/YkuD